MSKITKCKFLTGLYLNNNNYHYLLLFPNGIFILKYNSRRCVFWKTVLQNVLIKEFCNPITSGKVYTLFFPVFYMHISILKALEYSLINKFVLTC